MSVDSDRNSECSCQAEIREFDDTVTVYEQVLWFQVSVDNSTLMTVENGLCHLVQIAL